MEPLAGSCLESGVDVTRSGIDVHVGQPHRRSDDVAVARRAIPQYGIVGTIPQTGQADDDYDGPQANFTKRMSDRRQTWLLAD